MAFPTVEGTVLSQDGTDVTAHDILMPSGLTILANGIILVACAINGTPTITNPTGYTKLVDSPNSNATNKLVVFYNRAAGGEGATTYTTSAGEQSANPTTRT